MKSLATSFLLTIIFTTHLWAQKTIELKNLWARPQVHIKFNGYVLSFTIRDLNRALELLNETGDYSYGTKCNLDTSVNYTTELYNGTAMEYKDPVQPLIQNGVGGFLFTKGKVEIEDHNHKHLKTIELSMEGTDYGASFVFIQVYDPKTKKLLFSGKMATAMYNLDMGIDYY